MVCEFAILIRLTPERLDEEEDILTYFKENLATKKKLLLKSRTELKRVDEPSILRLMRGV
jgi:hypothetical protein